ncbi:MAG: hypothetical protein ACLP3C_17330 [Mycobacterium sp.]|uniref:hypothetical protein n=1 Tax=Mycobacterium sp. TaxID=1785 RepID=UPI003F9BE22A
MADGTVRPSVAFVGPLPAPPDSLGPVEAAIGREVDGLPMAAARPSLVEVAKVLGRVLDGKATSLKPAAAKQLGAIMDTLHKGAAPRRGGLSLVRSMTAPDRRA